MSDQWDAGRYDQQHAFVHQLAGDMIDLLAPKKGERILDLGCGTGHLTKKIADAGAEVVGIDSSPAMIAEAKRLFPDLSFSVVDASAMTYREEFDAVFSNAALHWIQPPEVAVQKMYDALKYRGRLVAEFGGKENVDIVLKAALGGGRKLGLDLWSILFSNYFPSIGEYSTLLEKHDFNVSYAALFDRPTPLAGEKGLQNWIRMFRPAVIEVVGENCLPDFFAEMERIAGAFLFHNGTWFADYCRLRVIAYKKQVNNAFTTVYKPSEV